MKDLYAANLLDGVYLNPMIGSTVEEIKQSRSLLRLVGNPERCAVGTYGYDPADRMDILFLEKPSIIYYSQPSD